MLPLRRIFIERQVKPEILNFCSDQDISNLFHIYYKYMNREWFCLYTLHPL